MKILHEVYFGKGPIAPLQKQLNKLRAKLANKPVSANTNLDPEVLKFNRLAEQIFGFKTFALYIQPNHLPNAYAFPVETYFHDPDEKKAIYKSLVASSSGFKYDEAFAHVSLVIAIHSGLLDNFNYTDEEIMGVILHEIGHGFFSAVTDPNCAYTRWVLYVNLLSSVMEFVKDKIKKGKLLVQEIIDKEISSLKQFTSKFEDVFRAPSLRKVFSESSFTAFRNLNPLRFSYTNEKFADTFAATYGYGAECQSCVVKLTQDIYHQAFGEPINYPKIIEILGAATLVLLELWTYLEMVQEEHPGQLARIKTNIEYIKKELSKDSIDPKIKRQLLDDLQRTEKLVQEYIDFPKDKDCTRILRLYHIALYKMVGGDFRELDTSNNALFDMIDSRYDQVLKRKSSKRR